MPRELLIIGCSGLAKEAAQLARRIDPHSLRWPRISYVGQTAAEIGTALPFGTVQYQDAELATRSEPADVVIGIGHPRARRMAATRLRANSALQFPNLVHPSVDIDPALVRLGTGHMLTLGVVVSCDIRIGDFNLLNWNSTVGHDAVLGSFNVINPSSSVSGRVTLGDA